MRTIIAGSRHIIDTALVVAHIERAPFAITGVLSGMANGVDTIGRKWAEAKGIPVEPFPALWTIEGNAAGPKRNQRMADAAEALVLVWDGTSPGSADMLRRAVKKCLWIHELRTK